MSLIKFTGFKKCVNTRTRVGQLLLRGEATFESGRTILIFYYCSVVAREADTKEALLLRFENAFAVMERFVRIPAKYGYIEHVGRKTRFGKRKYRKVVGLRWIPWDSADGVGKQIEG